MAKVSLRAYNREIETLMDRGQMDEAIAHCHHILKTFPKHLDTYRLLGKAYLEMKKYGDAVDIFSRVLVCVPNDFVAHVGMSIIRDDENKLDDAIWHMERAFEAQPSNAAIQGELQRLYGRRDGVQPPRIRMTRGALAQMYVQGELYPQAISEIKSVLKEDPGRSDMQSLLARACYRSGQKKEAAEVASSLLRRYPYSFDANRVLVEILGSDRPESVQAYRQRVFELDPYAAHVSGSILQSDDAPDSAVALERLDWTGQPLGMQADWRTSQGISLESGKDEQPEWLTSGFGESKTPPRFDEPQREPSTPTPFDFSAPPKADSTPANDDNIPDFLRQAGWGKSTGAFDESKPAFAEEETIPPTQAAPIAEGDMPDWIKAMAPAEALKPAEDEELPDWISKIGTGVLSSSTDSSSDQLAAFAESSGDQPDWLKQLGQTDAPVPSSSMADDQPDWLKQLGGEPEPARTEGPSNDFDFLNQVSEEQPATQFSEPAKMTDSDNLGTSEQERDDSFAWLENLAAKQGATEGLLTSPEDRLEKEPDWVKQAKSLNEQPEQPVMPTLSEMEGIPAQPAAAGLEELGKSEQERDDSFAWLENLAAKHGATEGLLTKPEDRLDQEPGWVRQAKGMGERPTAPPAGQLPGSSMDTAAWLRSLDEEVSKPALASEPAKDDTATWLKNLDEADAKPEPISESTNDDTAMWLKSLDEPEVKPVTQTDDMPAWMQNIEEEKTDSMAESVVPAVEADDSSAWIEPVEEPVSSETPKTDTGSLPSWLRGLDQEDLKASGPQDDLPAWLRDETGEAVAEPTKIEPTRAADWQPAETMETESFEAPVETPKPEPKPAMRKPAPAMRKSEARPATPVEPYKEPVTRKGTGMLTQTVDMVLGQARNELNRSNIPGALETYAKLIKRGRFLDEVIFDLREALYRYPVEVSIWQSLGDAYMRANRLQDALDAYTKAEELLR